MAKGKKKFNSGVPIDEEQRFLRMTPTDLAVEVSFERNAVEAQKEAKKKNSNISDLTKQVKEFEDALMATREVDEAKASLDEVKTEHMSDEHVEAKADLAALNKGWNDEQKDRKKKLKYMEKLLQRHIESGALKRKT
jgi:hypothetical protein